MDKEEKERNLSNININDENDEKNEKKELLNEEKLTNVNKEKKELTVQENELYILCKKFLTTFIIALIIYLFGFFGLSFAWLLIALIIWILKVKINNEKTIRVNSHRAIAFNEELMITNAFNCLPSWIHFPDAEKAEWINKIIKKMWPFIDEYAKRLMKDTIEPSIASALPDYLKSFRFEKVHLGTIPLRIGSIKCYDLNISRNEIILDMEIIYAGNCDIKVKVKGLSAGIKDLQLFGKMRVEMKPLLKEIPFIAGVSFYFLNNPSIDFNLTDLADILDLPGLSDIIRTAIMQQISAYLVLPNKYVLQLTDRPMKEIKFVQPMGVIRLEIIDGKNLKKSDIGMLGLGKSDPYCNIMIASKEYRTPIINNTVNPKWNYICEAIVHNIEGQLINIELMDFDQGSKDDFLGRCSLSVELIYKHKYVEKTLILEDTDTGTINVRATWLNFSEQFNELNNQINLMRLLYGNNYTPSLAALFVYLDCAQSLPYIGRTMSTHDGQPIMEPSPYVQLSIGKEKRLSSVKSSISNPVWEETFDFLINDPRREHELKVDVVDSKLNQTIGYLSINLNDLIKSRDMIMDKRFSIIGKGRECYLLMTIKLRLLKDANLNDVIHSTDHLDSSNHFVNDIRIDTNLNNNNNNICNSNTSNVSNGKINDNENNKIPSLEEMVFSTVQPIVNITNFDQVANEEQQKDLITENQLKRVDKSKLDTVRGSELNSIKSPKIQITLSKTTSDEITMLINKVVNLPLDGDNKPDSYVKIYPGTCNKDIRFKSEIMKATTDPVFEELFELGTLQSLPDYYEVTIWYRGSSVFTKNRQIATSKVYITDLFHIDETISWYDLELNSD